MTTKLISDEFSLRVGEHDHELACGRTALARARWMALLIALDVLFTFVVLNLAGGIATSFVFGGRLASADRLSISQVSLAAVGALVLVALAGGYGRQRVDFARLVVIALLGSWASVVIASTIGVELNLLQFAVAAIALPPAWALGRAAATRFQTTERVLIVGSGRVTEHIEELCRRHPERGFRVVGFVDENPSEMARCEVGCLGTISDLPSVLIAQDVDRIIVAWSLARDERIVDILRACDRHGVEVDTVPRMFDLIGTSPQVTSLGGVTLLGVRSLRTTLRRRALKRTLDIVGSVGLLLLLSPVLLATALSILVLDGRPILFRQERVGSGGRSFRIVKFRTMRPGADKVEAARVHALQNGELSIAEAVERIKMESTSQVTRIGAFLRATSIDEIPQLWNVLCGHMSLVGPRPLRDFEVEALGDWQLRRQDVRPGITGLWQVMGRSDMSWAERMQLDYSYARHWSMNWDIAILARTVRAVLSRKGSI